MRSCSWFTCWCRRRYRMGGERVRPRSLLSGSESESVEEGRLAGSTLSSARCPNPRFRCSPAGTPAQPRMRSLDAVLAAPPLPHHHQLIDSEPCSWRSHDPSFGQGAFVPALHSAPATKSSYSTACMAARIAPRAGLCCQAVPKHVLLACPARSSPMPHTWPLSVLLFPCALICNGTLHPCWPGKNDLSPAARAFVDSLSPDRPGPFFSASVTEKRKTTRPNTRSARFAQLLSIRPAMHHIVLLAGLAAAGLATAANGQVASPLHVRAAAEPARLERRQATAQSTGATNAATATATGGRSLSASASAASATITGQPASGGPVPSKPLESL